jgi:hypothetical protein
LDDICIMKLYINAQPREIISTVQWKPHNAVSGLYKGER